jgi:DNA-binding transcriptional LysR family regulator
MALELGWLRALAAADQEQSISRAAARLHLTQPAVSRQIARLESLVGTALLVRSPTGVTTTPAGDELLVHARRLLADADEALAAARRAAGRAETPLRVAFYCDLAATLMPDMIAAFALRHPTVPVDVAQMDFCDQLRRLRAEEIDVAFVRPFCDLAGLESQMLLPEPVVVALPRTHRLADAVSVPLAELADEQWITMTPAVVGDAAASSILARLRAAGVRGEPKRTSSLQAGVGMAAAGQGVFACPASTAATTPPSVVFLPVEGWFTGVSMLWRAGPVAPVVKAFLRSCADAASEVPSRARSTVEPTYAPQPAGVKAS